MFAFIKFYWLKLNKTLTNNSDAYGILVCALCIIHCIITPFTLIIFNYSNNQHITSKIWWKNLDYVFLIISFFMVYFSTQTTTKVLMKYLFWLIWVFLFGLIMNEKVGLFLIPEFIMYATAILLAGVHFYNHKFCRCKI